MRRSPDRHGAAAVELAMLLPLLVLICSIAADWCRVYHFAQVVNSAAQQGAMAASGNAPRRPGESPEAAGKRWAKAAGVLNPALRDEDITVSIDGTTGDATVEVRWVFYSWMPGWGTPASKTFTRRVRMPSAPY